MTLEFLKHIKDEIARMERSPFAGKTGEADSIVLRNLKQIEKIYEYKEGDKISMGLCDYAGYEMEVEEGLWERLRIDFFLRIMAGHDPEAQIAIMMQGMTLVAMIMKSRDSRERSLALTALDVALMWACKATAVTESSQKNIFPAEIIRGDGEG